MKRCHICGIEKELSGFRAGYAKCKACTYLVIKEWVGNNREKHRAANRTYYARHREECRKKVNEQLNANRASINARRSELRKLNPEKHRARDRQRQPAKTVYQRERKRTHLSFRISCVLRSRINDALKRQFGKAGTLRELLGCSVVDFKIYLESKFEPGMSWENYGSKWHIDHIMPCAIFDMQKPEHQKRCFHFSNQQPLWKLDNLRKNKYPTSAQFLLI